MADVMETPENAFGYVPTPALVAPIEFTMRPEDYAALGGHVDDIVEADKVVTDKARRVSAASDPRDRLHFAWGRKS